MCPSVTFLVIVSSLKPLDVATSNFAGAQLVASDGSCNLDPKVKAKGQIMYFL